MHDMSFLTPDCLNAIGTLLTLNTPQLSKNSVIPLGMAAWLNQPEVVCVLLEDGTDAVSVDGMDFNGAMALMCEWSVSEAWWLKLIQDYLLFIELVRCDLWWLSTSSPTTRKSNSMLKSLILIDSDYHSSLMVPDWISGTIIIGHLYNSLCVILRFSGYVKPFYAGIDGTKVKYVSL